MPQLKLETTITKRQLRDAHRFFWWIIRVQGIFPNAPEFLPELQEIHIERMDDVPPWQFSYEGGFVTTINGVYVDLFAVHDRPVMDNSGRLVLEAATSRGCEELGELYYPCKVYVTKAGVIDEVTTIPCVALFEDEAAEMIRDFFERVHFSEGQLARVEAVLQLAADRLYHSRDMRLEESFNDWSARDAVRRAYESLRLTDTIGLEVLEFVRRWAANGE